MGRRAYTEDLIEVREDERFEADRVAEFLRGKLPGTDQPLTIRQFSGGAANLTYLLDYGTHQYVLRRPPLGPVAASSHDMNREYTVLSVLYQSFPKAPRAHLFSDDPEIVGAPFFVMDRYEGVVVRRKIPKIFEPIPDAPKQMSEALVDTLVDFHAVDYNALGLSSLGRPKGFIHRQIEGWYRRWENAQTDPVPEMDRVYEWLLEKEPQSAQHSLVHNDYKLDNVMWAFDDPGKVVAIFDWDMCTLGDPLSDLGALLAYWSQPSDPPYALEMARMPAGDLDFLTRSELVRRYAEKSKQSVMDINFYYALALFRVAVIIAQIYIRYVRGQTQDQRFAVFGQVVPLFARLAEGVAMGDLGVEI
jgi:aminoglycoside phosphotransferase (APT) family kinase protein